MNFKLNLKKKPRIGNLKQPGGIREPLVQKRPLFQVDNSDDDDENEQDPGLQTKNNQGKSTEELKYEMEKEQERQKKIRLQQREEESKRITEHSRILSRKYAKEAEEQQKANPKAFQYDEIYDDIKQSKEKNKKKGGYEQKSTYIDGLLASKTERDRRNNEAKELRIKQQLREEEELFGKKETFVTGTYQKQLEKNAREKAKQKIEDTEEEKRRKRQESKRKEGAFTRSGAGMKNVYLRFLEDGGSEEEEEEDDDDGNREMLSNGLNTDIGASNDTYSGIPFTACSSRSSDGKDSNSDGDTHYSKLTKQSSAASNCSQSDSYNDIKGVCSLNAGLNLTNITAGLSSASTVTSQHIDNRYNSNTERQKLSSMNSKLNENEKYSLRELATRLFHTKISESEINQAKARYYKRKKQRQRGVTVY